MSQQPLDDRTKKLEVFLIDLLMALSHDQTQLNIVAGAATLNKFSQFLKTGNPSTLGNLALLDIPPTLSENAKDLLNDWGLASDTLSPSHIFCTNIVDVGETTTDPQNLTYATLNIERDTWFPSSST